ncbi:transporter substrate-binding domain-containing protein [Roseibium denhamense]|uniref:Amino acid ABC transporter substrate-binding protein, PAAT family n=1 Tax=Roseibium denhamense TaxID=76305 RepID=A0ABY1PRQ5_9HYPH|nr:transporter substrate-binding domain-containing protein [Roseibium denhamense]MTI03965.1 transporter substrate-binding domain-containing protein [Roseibium denhamense]SMP37368.1 amino acid ABC transporter substrate-binding protein, PAAT family [Roseibium denhamense]
MKGHVFTAGLLLITAPATADVRFVQDEAYPPYMMKAQDTPAGILADIVLEAARRMDVGGGLTLEAIPWPRAVKLTEVGKANGLVGAYYQPEARPWIATYSEPLLIEQVGIYCRYGIAEADWAYPDDYIGLVFGNNFSFETPGPEFFAMVEAEDIILEEALTTEQNLMKVNLNRIDCYVQERLVAQKVIKENALANVEFISVASEERSMVAYPDAWDGPEAAIFIKAFDEAIIDMREDGTIKRIIADHVGG